MEEDLIRRQLMKTAGDLEKEERMICEMGEKQAAAITVSTQWLTIICC